MTTRGARATTLDAALAEVGVHRVDFVKMDVDGHECGVLRGATDTLRQGPRILMELAPYVLDETGASIEELVEILVAAGDALAAGGGGRRLRLQEEAIGALAPGGSWRTVLATRARAGASPRVYFEGPVFSSTRKQRVAVSDGASDTRRSTTSTELTSADGR